MLVYSLVHTHKKRPLITQVRQRLILIFCKMQLTMTPSFILTYQYFVKNHDRVTTGKLKKQRLPSQTRHKVAI